MSQRRGADDADRLTVDLLEEIRAALDGLEPLLLGRMVDIEMPRLRLLTDPTLCRRLLEELIGYAVGSHGTAGESVAPWASAYRRQATNITTTPAATVPWGRYNAYTAMPTTGQTATYTPANTGPASTRQLAWVRRNTAGMAPGSIIAAIIEIHEVAKKGERTEPGRDPVVPAPSLV